MAPNNNKMLIQDRAEEIIPAIIAALKNGEDSIRVYSPNDHTKVHIIDVPDNNELLALQEIVKEYELIIHSGNDFVLREKERIAYNYIKQLIEVSQKVKHIDVPPVHKNAKEVKNEIVSWLFDEWEQALENNSDKQAAFFSILLPHSESAMREVFRNAVREGYIDDSTAEADFLYYFGAFSSEPPKGRIKWLHTLVELAAFVTAFSGDAYNWVKAADIFLIRNKKGVYYAPTQNSLKQSSCRDGGKDYNKASGRRIKLRESLLSGSEM